MTHIHSSAPRDEDEQSLGIDDEGAVGERTEPFGIPEDDASHLGTKRVEDGVRAAVEASLENTPLGVLSVRLTALSKEMREKDLEQDAAIVDKLHERIVRQVEVARQRRESLSKDWYNGHPVSFEFLQQAPHYRVPERSIVTREIGNGGGWVYGKEGFENVSFGDGSDIEGKHQKQMQEYIAQGREIVNYSFTREGETLFYRALGAIAQTQDVDDVPAVASDQQLSRALRSHPQGTRLWHTTPPRGMPEYKGTLDTDIDGITIEMEKTTNSYYDGKRDSRIGLHFDTEVMKSAVEQHDF